MIFERTVLWLQQNETIALADGLFCVVLICWVQMEEICRNNVWHKARGSTKRGKMTSLSLLLHLLKYYVLNEHTDSVLYVSPVSATAVHDKV